MICLKAFLNKKLCWEVKVIALKCDVCGSEIEPTNLGFVKNPRDGEKVTKCKGCHEVNRPQKESSYTLI